MKNQTIRDDALEWQGECVIAGSSSRITLEGPHPLSCLLGATCEKTRFTLLNSLRLGGTVLLDHSQRRYSEARRRGPEEERPKGVPFPHFRAKGNAVRLPGSGKSTLGPTVRWMWRIGLDRGEATLFLDTLAKTDVRPGALRSLLRSLFPAEALGESLARQLRSIGGIPVLMTLHRSPDEEPLGAWQAVDVAAYEGNEDDFGIPDGYLPVAAVSGTPADFPSGPLVVRLVPVGPPELPEPILPIPDVPLDAGYGLSHRFLGKLGEGVSALANTFDPFEASDLRPTVDWFETIMDGLDAAGVVDTDVVFSEILLGVEFHISAILANVTTLTDFPELRDLLTDDERASLETSIADNTGDDRWFDWTNVAIRTEVAFRFAMAHPLAPQRLDLRPTIPFDTPIRMFQEVNEDGEVVEGTGLQVGLMTYLRSSNRVYIYHLLDLMNGTISKIRPRVEVADDLVPLVDTRANGFQLQLANQKLVIDFDFVTSPAATLTALLAILYTYTISFWALWNSGVGAFVVDSSVFSFRLRPRLAADDAFIGHRLDYVPQESHVDLTFWSIGWNPLNDVLLLAVSAFVSIFDTGAREVAGRLRRQLRTQIDERHILEFPRSFNVGQFEVRDSEDEVVTERDSAGAFVAAPIQAEPIITDGESVFYRGIYGSATVLEDRPLNVRLGRDGAYFFHRQVLQTLIGLRLGTAAEPLDVPLPALNEPLENVIPAEIRAATAFNPDLLAQLVALGFMNERLRQAWLAYLEARRPLLVAEGFAEGVISIRAAPLGILTTSREGRVVVRWADGQADIPAEDPVGAVRIVLTGRHMMQIRFVREDGLDLLVWLSAQEANEWNSHSLPSGIALPGSVGAIHLIEAEVSGVGELHVGLFKSAPHELVPGFLAAFDFAVRGVVPDAEQRTALFLDSVYATEERAAFIRQALLASLAPGASRLERELSNVIGYVAARGLLWRVTDEEQTTRFVRTEGERLYLDFEIDPIIVPNLGGE